MSDTEETYPWRKKTCEVDCLVAQRRGIKDQRTLGHCSALYREARERFGSQIKEFRCDGREWKVGSEKRNGKSRFGKSPCLNVI